MSKQFLIEDVELIPESPLAPIYFVVAADNADPKEGFAIQFVAYCASTFPEAKAVMFHEGEYYEAHPATFGLARFVSLKCGSGVVIVPVIRLSLVQPPK